MVQFLNNINKNNMQSQKNNLLRKQKGLQAKTDFVRVADENFTKWNELLQTNDPKQVANLYAEDATFLPTVSGDFKKGQNGAEEYFCHFMEKKPEGVITESVVQAINDECYLQSGKYDFELGPEDSRSILHARFTFLWKRNEQGDWQIAHHHSSLNPRK